MKQKDPLRNPLLITLLVFAAFAISVGIVILLSMLDPPKSGTYPPGTITCRNQPMTPEELRPFLKNAFANHEYDFFNAAINNGIDVILLVAIAQHETGYGTSNAVRNYNNPGGIMTNGGRTLKRFSTLAEGLQFMAQNLYKNYIRQGLTTIPQIGKKYAPIGASNDPNGLNRHWVPTVTKIANEMGGISGNCAETGGIVSLPQSEYGFQFPQKRIVLTSPFGPRNGGFHYGIDMDLGDGTEILASQAGTVEFAAYGTDGSGFGGYGNTIVINHHNGFWTLYGHLSKIHVKVGQQVQRGQVIGIIGNTGDSRGTHLHFEIKTSFLFGQVDPKPYLPPY